jgi:hypothetical protein
MAMEFNLPNPSPAGTFTKPTTIDDLELVADRLTEDTEALSASLKVIEDRLNRLGLGVTASVPINDPPQVFLYYARFTGKWGLYILEDEGRQVWPILQAPRVHRTAVPLLLPQLIEAMKQEAEKLAVAMQRAVQLLKVPVAAIQADMGNTETKGNR